MKSDTKKINFELNEMKSVINDINIMLMVQKHNSYPGKMDSPKDQDNTTVVPTNKKAQPLEGGNSTKIGGMWTLKHEIGLPKFYELLIETKIKVYTSLDLNNL